MKNDLNTITEHRNVQDIVTRLKDEHIKGESHRIIEGKTPKILRGLSTK